MMVSFLALYYWSETSRVIVRPANYSQRIDAANTMLKSMEVLENYRLPALNLKSGHDGEDALVYTMLGEKDSPIITDEGKIDDKITVLNPNFAAAMVDLLAQTGLTSGDTVAVLLTGSMPGANLAIFSASKAMGLHLIPITSVGSSWWGANMPDFTWLDMERVLYDKQVFTYRSLAASIGGSNDQGGIRLSEVGRNMIVEAIERNELVLIRQGNLSENIKARIELFNRILPIDHYKALVNVGGGIAAIGHPKNSELIPNGLNKHLPVVNYPGRGVLHHFADEGVPVVQIYDVQKLARSYELPIAHLPIPKVGVGSVFETEKYNLVVAGIATFLMLLILGVVKYLDRQQYKWREEGVDPDTLV
jgi:poly-gamma-glutamate system protein